MGKIVTVFTGKAPKPSGHYSQAVRGGGAQRQDVLKVTAYIVGVENWPVFNQAFAEVFGDHRPSRSVVPVPELHHGYLIEIDGVALDAAAT